MKVWALILLVVLLSLSLSMVMGDKCFDALPEKMIALTKDLSKQDVEGYIQSELRLWGLESKVQLTVPDLNEYITRTHGCWKKNNILTEKFCQWENFLAVGNDADFKDMFQQAFLHSIYLHLLNEFIKQDYVRAKELFQVIQTNINGLKHSTFFGLKIFNYASLFESGKLNLILPALAESMDLIISKKPIPKDPNRCGQRINGVSLNIGEATLFDLDNGYYDNAESALPMMLAPNAEQDDPRFETRSTYFDEANKIIMTFQPFPTEWAKLYESWNLAFTMGEYDNFPMYWAKLLNPSTSCYHDIPGSYLHNRGVTLLLHIIHEIFWRYKIGPLHNYHLKNREATNFHGLVNLQYSRVYKSMIDKVDPNLINPAHLRELQDIIDAYRNGSRLSIFFKKLKYGFKKIMSLVCMNPSKKQTQAFSTHSSLQPSK